MARRRTHGYAVYCSGKLNVDARAQSLNFDVSLDDG